MGPLPRGKDHVRVSSKNLANEKRGRDHPGSAQFSNTWARSVGCAQWRLLAVAVASGAPSPSWLVPDIVEAFANTTICSYSGPYLLIF